MSHELLRGLPEGMAGRFQGVRMIFAVMLPMIIGPFIGSAVIKNSAESYMELGVSKQVPTPAIFLSAALALLLIVLPLLWLSLHRVEQIPTAIVGPSVSGELRPLESSYAADIDRNCPLPEYPRPQLSRAETSWKNLNGIWRYAIRKGSLPSAHDETIVMPQADGDILVPYSPESLLSTVQRRLLPDEVLWYERILEEEDLPEIPQNGRLLLHCGAVDQLCHVYLNGKRAGEHEGGYLAFTCDITDWIQPGSNRLTLAVTDPSQKGERAYGKQTLHRGKIWYSTSSGIWQTIWLEAVPEAYIADIKLIPNCQSASIRMELDLRGGQAVAPLAEHKNTLSLHIFMPSAQITKTFTLHQSTPARLILEVAVPNMRCWSPEDPYLYHYELRWGQDTVKAYFAMRSFGIMKDEAGIPRLSLNGRPYMQIGILDQGYWSDGMYTPPSEQAMVDDILRMKALGFNMLRKHIKIEAARWYHHCDRLGMLVWQDMVSGGGPYKTSVIALLPFFSIFLKDTKNYRRFGRASASSRLIFEEEVRATIQQLYSVPSIALWVPFNEAWGQFDAARIRDLVHELDPSRPIDHASGWHDQGAGDLKSRHVYFKKIRLQADRGGRPLALTEFGGFSYAVPGHTSNSKEYGYKPFQTLEAYQQGVLDLMEKLQQQPPLLAATVYTQVSDVEDEINGLLTYDRRVSKWPEGSPAAERLLAIHLRLRQFPDGSSPLKQDPPKNDG